MTNEIVLFDSEITENVLVQFEENAKKFEGLAVDMDNPDERRFIKKESSDITDLIKKLDRRRIDMQKEEKDKIQDEFDKIVERLNKCNDFCLGEIKAYNAKQKAIRDAEKEVQRLKDELYQKGIDHEEAIAENELYDLRKEKQARELKEMQEKMIEEAKKQADIDLELAEEKRLRDVEQAKIDEKNRILAEQQAIADAKVQREANEAHVLSCMTEAKEALMLNTGIDEETARKVIIAIKNGTARLSINF